MRKLLPALVTLAGGLLAAVVSAQPPAEPISPAQVLVAMAADLTAVREVDGKVLVPALDPGTARTTRYLWNDTGVPKAVIDGHLNLLNRRGIKVTTKVTPYLYRLDTADYGEAFRDGWEKLGTGVDWVFHDEEFTEEIEFREVEEDVEYGFWESPDGTRRAGGARRSPDEKWITTKVVKEKVRKQVVKKAKGIAAWVADDPRAKVALETVQAKMGGTDVPVVAWSQLLWETAIQEDRTVGYYGMLGLKGKVLADWERVAGVVKKGVDPERLAEVREVVANSTVTHPKVLRRIVRQAAVGGDYFFTLDANQDRLKKADRDRGNPLFEHGDGYISQALEGFANLPNGMPLTVLANDKGELQDKAPDFIATDSTAPRTDRNVHVNLSCVRCHSEGGMKDVRGWVRNVLNLPPNQLNGKTPEERRQLAEYYVERRLEPFIRTYRERVDEACLQVTGMKFSAFSAAYAKEWAAMEGPVDVERAAMLLGTTPARYVAALRAQKGSVHPSLAAHRLEKPEPVPMILFIRAYPYAQYALAGKIKPFKVEVKDK